MTRKKKINRFPAVTSGVLFLVMGILKIAVPSDNYYQTVVFLLSNIVFFGIVFCWGLYIERSILSPKIRRLMLAVVVFMVMYILIGSSKNRVFLDGNFAGRLLWYLYYIPQIFATYLAFIITFRVGKKEEYRLPKIFYALYGVAVVLVVLYLLNDVHQLAFRFNLDFVAWDQQYDWGPLFYISTAWIYFFLIAGVIMLSVKCRAVNKKKAWLPVFWLAVGSLYIFSDYIFDIWNVAPFNLPETHCFILIAMLESSIRIGILPSNSAYGEIVSKSSVAIQIADTDNNVIYRSDNAVRLTEEQMNEAKRKNVFVDKNTLLLSNSINGGYVFWTENLTAVNEMNDRLSQISQSLSEEGDLIRAENELREQRAKIAEQTRLYDSISESVRPQLEKISLLITDDENFYSNMAQVCILNCYVKRMSNLALLRDKNPYMSSEELYLSLKESSEYLKLHGGVSDVRADSFGTLSADMVILCFDIWQNVIESLLPEPCIAMSKIGFDGADFIFRITAETQKKITLAPSLRLRVEELGGVLCTNKEDSTLYITLKAERVGEKK